MLGKQILEALQQYSNIPFAHYSWSHPEEFDSGEVPYYGVYSEDHVTKIELDNRRKEEVLVSTVDVFCYEDSADEAKFAVEQVFDTFEIAYELQDWMFEYETSLIHLSWDIMTIYSPEVRSLYTLFISDLNEHLCFNFDKAQISEVERNKIIPSNIRLGVTILGVEGELQPGEPHLETREVQQLIESQTILPSTGFDGMSRVELTAVKQETSEAQYGNCLTIGGA